jgi:hypothetical protein
MKGAFLLAFKRPHKSTSIFHIPKWAREFGWTERDEGWESKWG